MEISGYRQREETVWNRERSLKPGGCSYNLRLYRLGDGRENISTASSRRWLACRARNRSASGSIHRRRKRFCAASAKRRICPNTIIWRIRAYLAGKRSYLMGINFSRALTLKYGPSVSNYMRSSDRTVISVGRVMTCVLGMVVRREREIRNLSKTPFNRVIGTLDRQVSRLTANGGRWKKPLLWNAVSV